MREQLIAQITLGIASGDLKVGEKLPSTREIARRCDLHSNTVGSAYQKLVDQELLEFRKGSGFYVGESATERIAGKRRLEQLLQEFFESAKALGFDQKDIAALLKKRQTFRSSDQFVVVESDAGLREILIHEISERFPKTTGVTLEEYLSGGVAKNATLAAMFDEKPKIDPHLNDGQHCVYLKGRSVSAAMSGQERPTPDDLIAVASGWDGFLSFARIMLLAANINPGSLIVRSTSDDGWREAIKSASIVICDTLTAVRLGKASKLRQFQIISEESFDELAIGSHQRVS